MPPQWKTSDPGQSILIVDDDVTSVRLIRLLLEREGYDVRSAFNADEALHVLETFLPQIILMDIQLPGMDGLELTRQLKANTRTREISIVAFTGWSSETIEQETLNAGCDGYIAKPVEPLALTQLITEHLRRGRLRRHYSQIH